MKTEEQDPWTMQIDAWLTQPDTAGVHFVTVEQVLSEVITTDKGRTQRANQMRLSSILHSRGWAHERRTPTSGAKRVWGYFRP